MPISCGSSIADALVTVPAAKSSKIPSKWRRLYPMPVSSSSAATAFLSAGCCFGLRRQACLLGALAAFQTVAVVTVILSALSEAGNGVGTRLTPMSIVASGSGDPSGFVDRLNARLGTLAFGVPPPSSIGSLRTDELNVTNSTYGELNWNGTWSDSDELNVTLIEMQSVLYGADCVETFLSHYEEFCNVAMTTDVEDGQNQRQSMELCPCVPRQRLSKILCIFSIVI
jgi:hypothetical protein